MKFETERLIIRKSTTSDEDVNMFHALWNNPVVMTLVSFPDGLHITKDEIRESIAKEDDTEYNKKLVVVVKSSGALIGECKLGLPGEDGISETDVKLLPEYWGNGYGKEIKRWLVDYLFTHTDCKGVMGSPNKLNIASQKMQEYVGAKKVGESLYEAPEDPKRPRTNVHAYIYIVYRDDWEKQK